MKKIGDDGMGFDDTPESIEYGKFSAYLSYVKDVGFSHEKALQVSGLTQAEYEKLYKKYLPNMNAK